MKPPVSLLAAAAAALTPLGTLVARLAPPPNPPPMNIVADPGFETVGGSAADSAVPGWGKFWSRKPGAGTMQRIVGGEARSGGYALQVSVSGADSDDDWAVTNDTVVPTAPGDVWTLAAWSRGVPPAAASAAPGGAQISVLLRDKDGRVLDWLFAPATLTTSGAAWIESRRRFVVPENGATIQVRITGAGRTALLVDDVSLVHEGSLAAMRKSLAGQAAEVRAKATPFLDVRLVTATGALIVTDRRSHRVWSQNPLPPGIIAESVRAMPDGGAIDLGLWDIASDLHLHARITPSANAPEVSVTVSGDGPLATDGGRIAYPPPWKTVAGDSLVVPLNEGILYPVDDPAVRPMELVAYSGHGICMPWFGQFAGDAATGATAPGVMTLLNTPDDARIAIQRPGNAGGEDSRLRIQPEWEASRGRFSYPRKVTFVFFDRGGYVAQAKRYREYAKATGLFKTLAQKRAANPNVDKLIGAVNVWNWDMDRVKLCREMKAAGMDYVLWSAGGQPDELRAINEMGYLTGRYDIYQDVWPPLAPKLNHEGWPEDLMWDSHGKPYAGWESRVHNPDGTLTAYPGGIICSPRGLARAKVKIPEDLATHPYGARFLDTTTAAPFRECYNPAHPLTRSEDRHYKMALLDFCSKDEKLVLGTETGIDPSVPYADYYEGMMSLGPYRLPDAGRDMLLYKKPTPEFLRFMVGPVYRVPLWELVYHDCVVADWYWGDYNNKAPEVWDRRDLFNILYGTPPMFLFDRAGWTKNKAHFVASYQAICPLVRRLGYDEMVEHRFLTADHTLQQTRWKSGVVVTVNFSDKAQKTPEGVEVGAMGWKVTEGHPAKAGT